MDRQAVKKRSPQLSWLSMAVLAIALSSLLAFLYSRTQENDKSAYFENLAQVQHLKRLDAEWEVDVLRLRLGIDQNYDALTRTGDGLNALLAQLQAAIAAQQPASSGLVQSSAALAQAIEHKTTLIEHFKPHNSVARHSLMSLPTAAQDLQYSLSAANNHTALLPISREVNSVLLATMLYGRAATTEKAVEIHAELNALLQGSRKQVPPAAAEKLAVFAAHTRTILGEMPVVNELLGQIAATATTARFDAIDRELTTEQQRAATQAQHYRQYLLIFAAVLISLFLYAAIRLVRSHAVINRVNEDFRKANENLEQRVQERTRELANSLSLLNATLDSASDGILAIQFSGEVVCSNARFATMWGMPVDALQKDGDARSVNFVLALVKNPEQFIQRIKEINANPEVESFDVLELKDGRTVERYVRPQKIDGAIVGLVINFRDVTERKQAQAELENTHQKLLDASRRAGMAEVATNVLHNVGNVLNSVNVSANLVSENMKHSKVAGLAKVAALLREHAANLPAFMANDSRGKYLPEFLQQLCERLLAEQQVVIKELELLRNNVDHIKEIVTMQQSYSKVSGIKEAVNVIDLIEDALRMNETELQLHGVRVRREFTQVPPLHTEKHKVLQILVNLVRNAKYACIESGRPDKCMTLSVAYNDGQMKISTSDNGIGIAPENLTRIFGHGFTTRKDGHGFGLHSGALAARELGGQLHVHSDGIGMGATFTLELPLDALEPANV